MKALTIWQPWASLLAAGVKKYETRGWPTSYRGPILIHAAKRPPAHYLEHAVPEIGPLEELPTGMIIAKAELVDVWNIKLDITSGKARVVIGEHIVPTQAETALGDWRPGRYAWELGNVEILPEPIPARGQQGLWNYPGM